MILRELPALAEAIGSAPTSAPAGEGAPFVDPRLVCTYQPARMWRSAGRGEASSDPHGHNRWRRIAGPWPEACPLGLSPARNPDTQGRRNGWRGITPSGRREVRRSCCALDDQRARLAFWTITLSDRQAEWIARYDRWSEFQSAIRHRLVRQLQRKGLRPLVVGVVELHPKRSRKLGRPIPHLHVCFVGRAHAWGRWLLTTADLDLIIVQALVAAQCFDLDVSASGNVQPVRRSVARYLSKYMSKGGEELSSALTGWELVPRQWWFRSAMLKRMTDRLRVHLPREFVAWIHGRPEVLERMGWGSWHQLSLPDSRAPNTYAIRWESVAALAAAMVDWQESLWDADWRLNHCLSHDRPQRRQHPGRD